MTRRPAAHPRGFTLLELVLVIGLAAVLGAVAAPGFGWLRADTGTAVAADQLVAGLQFARSSALARATPASLCTSADGATCSEAASRPASGWLVFLGTQPEEARAAGPDAVPLRVVRLQGGYRVVASRSLIAYWPDARAGTTGTFVVCRAGAPSAARTVVVSQTGRPRIGVASAAQGAACAA